MKKNLATKYCPTVLGGRTDERSKGKGCLHTMPCKEEVAKGNRSGWLSLVTRYSLLTTKYCPPVLGGRTDERSKSKGCLHTMPCKEEVAEGNRSGWLSLATRYSLLITLILCALCIDLSAQTIKELEAQKKKALDELAVTNRLLNETQKNKKGTENKLNLLKQSIKQSTNYINALNKEIGLLDENISSLQASRLSHQERLERLRNEYAQTTRAIYSHHKYFSPLLFVISADNFNQAVRRFRYLQQVAAHRKYQAQEIAKITQQLQIEEDLLTENRIQKETAVSAKELEQQRLEQQRRKRNDELASLKKKETSLKKKQKEQQKKADKLNQKIQDMIAAEIKRQKEEAAKKAKQEGKKDPYELSKEEKLVAGNFEANKGKLPRPVEKGFISGHFGVQPHPFLDKVQVNNKGTYFQIPAGSDARAVFEGEVTQCFSVPGSNQSVIVKHGNYRTVYSNLVTLYVKVGDKVSTKQKIGKVYTDTENDNKTELYFMLYKDTEIQNPENWLAN